MGTADTMRPASNVLPGTLLPTRTLAIAGVVALAVAGRLTAGWNAPLWFDETFSAVIASQRNVPSLIDWCLAEIGGPVYYVLLWLWAQLFGTSAAALRSLSLLCSLGAPVIAWRIGHPAAKIRLSWAMLLALWTPTFDGATNARCYGLLLLVNVLQAIAFLRLLRSPTRRDALVWTGLSVLGILTHYHTAVLAGVQGIMFLAMHRRAAVRCWPALLALAPLACWMPLHLPLLLRFSSAGSWYPPMRPIELLASPTIFFESTPLGVIVALGTIATFVAVRRGWTIDAVAAPDRAVALSGVIALAILLLVSTLKPTFTWRYAAVFAPTILFGVAVWMHAIERRIALAPLAILAMFAASAAGKIEWCLEHRADNYRFAFNLDQPSAWLAESHPRRLGFLWDSPTGTMSDPRRLQEVAGFFLAQAGEPARVSVLKAWPGTDPRRTVADRVRRGAIDSLVWISDVSIPGTMAPTDAAAMARAGWTCRDFGRHPITLLACRPARARAGTWG